MNKGQTKKKGELHYGAMITPGIPPDVLATISLRLGEHASRNYALAKVQIFLSLGDVHVDLHSRHQEFDAPWRISFGPLCRLRWTGDPDYWGFGIWLVDEERFSIEGEYGALLGGTPEACMDEAVRFLIYGEGPQ